MSIKTTNHVTCDSCGDTIDIDYDDWADFLDQFKAEGWRSRKVDDEWEHYCPDCRY